MSQLPWVLYTDQSLEQGRFLGKLEWVSLYLGNGCLCILLYLAEWVSLYLRICSSTAWMQEVEQRRSSCRVLLSHGGEGSLFSCTAAPA